jgi:hypothetical protein
MIPKGLKEAVDILLEKLDTIPDDSEFFPLVEKGFTIFKADRPIGESTRDFLRRSLMEYTKIKDIKELQDISAEERLRINEALKPLLENSLVGGRRRTAKRRRQRRKQHGGVKWVELILASGCAILITTTAMAVTGNAGIAAYVEMALGSVATASVLSLFTLVPSRAEIRPPIEAGNIPLPPANVLPHNTAGVVPIYVYIGHGRDICNMEEFKLELSSVPDDCLYVNSATCGLTTETDFKKVLSFLQSSPEILANPIENKDLIETSIKEDNFYISLQIYRPNPSTNSEKFVNNTFQPFDIHKLPTHMGTPKFLIGTHSGLISSTKVVPSIKYGVYELESISLNHLVDIFRASVYPTPEQIHNYFISKYGNSADSFTYDQLKDCSRYFYKPVRTIMEQLKGIHYNLLCRNTSSACDGSSIMLRRANSLGQGRSIISVLEQSFRFGKYAQLV